MEITCNMAKDLANLYLCGAASDDSISAVEEHLLSCSCCRAFYDSYKSMLGNNDSFEAVDYSLSDEKLNEKVKILSSKLRKKRRLTHIANTSLLIGGAAMLSVGLAFLINSGDKQ